MAKAFIFWYIVFSAVGAGYAQQQPSAGSTFSIGPMGQLGHPVSDIGGSIVDMFQDSHNCFWFASNGEGVFRYDGNTIYRFTDRDGLCSNFVRKVQEDVNGILWFTTRDGICRFDGKRFTDYTFTLKRTPYGLPPFKKAGLFFSHPGGVSFYDGKGFTNFVIHPASYQQPRNNNNRPYDVYSTWVDRLGQLWFGTQEKGVAVYNGYAFSYIDAKGLGGPAVRCVYQDSKGIYWFGNNGGGLFRYDGITLQNITEERKLGNADFLSGRRLLDKPGTLARVFAIAEDREGTLWVGTADAGVWSYDGKQLKNYTTRDGLPGNAVTAIFKDRKGELYFISAGMVCRKQGAQFYPYRFN